MENVAPKNEPEAVPPSTARSKVGAAAPKASPSPAADRAREIVGNTRKRILRAMTKTQRALAWADIEGECEPRTVSAIAREIRRALLEIDVVEQEIAKELAASPSVGGNRSTYVPDSSERDLVEEAFNNLNGAILAYEHLRGIADEDAVAVHDEDYEDVSVRLRAVLRGLVAAQDEAKRAQAAERAQ